MKTARETTADFELVFELFFVTIIELKNSESVTYQDFSVDYATKSRNLPHKMLYELNTLELLLRIGD